MVERYWPAGVPDDPLADTLTWTPVENGLFFSTGPGRVRAAPVSSALAVNLTADYPMSDHQFHGLWLPWWLARGSAGGVDNGLLPFWLRDPIQRDARGNRRPFLFMRQEEGGMQTPKRDGAGWIITLSLMRLPT